jgi:hypothetical protein
MTFIFTYDQAGLHPFHATTRGITTLKDIPADITRFLTAGSEESKVETSGRIP